MHYVKRGMQSGSYNPVGISRKITRSFIWLTSPRPTRCAQTRTRNGNEDSSTVDQEQKRNLITAEGRRGTKEHPTAVGWIDSHQQRDRGHQKRSHHPKTFLLRLKVTRDPFCYPFRPARRWPGTPSTLPRKIKDLLRESHQMMKTKYANKRKSHQEK